MSSLKLGNVDKGSMPASKKDFLGKFHEAFVGTPLAGKVAFRDEPNSEWQPFQEIEGGSIRELQAFLKEAGFMPHGSLDGIYGYATQAAVRLFQEYIRTVEGDPTIQLPDDNGVLTPRTIGIPDGKAGPTTLGFLADWKAKKAGKENFVCDWGKSNPQNGTEEFNKWIGLLQQAKELYASKSNGILAFSEAYTRDSDTKKIKNWETSPDAIHLIGIRRREGENTLVEKIRKNKKLFMRVNDDLFVLLINGMVFKFWGSTDPSPDMLENVRHQPFLIEGQHSFRFAWHHINTKTETVYRALKPATVGVLVFRDWNEDKLLTDEDIAKGLDKAPNTTINIHWSGKGDSNFSAGCQVIAGLSYINNAGIRVDCEKFASLNYTDLANGKTRGAYNVFTDLLLSYAPENVKTISYTLARDESFLGIDGFDDETFAVLLKRLKSDSDVA